MCGGPDRVCELLCCIRVFRGETRDAGPKHVLNGFVGPPQLGIAPLLIEANAEHNPEELGLCSAAKRT